MEYCGPTTILDIFRQCLRGPFPDALLLGVLEVLHQSLQELPRSGYVHCDLKANNVIVTWDTHSTPRAHIIDFRLTVQTGQRSLLRSNEWYAPETPQGHRMYPATDVVGFALIVR